VNSIPKKPLVGMVCAGAVSRTTAGTHPRILQHLGPVKAASLRVASRAVNAIRAGTPVSTYQELGAVSVILISAPDAEIEALVAEFANSGLRWKQKTVLLADSQFDSAVLSRVAEAGSATGSFNVLPEFQNRKFLVEGDPSAVRAMRRLLESGACRPIAIRPGSKSEYFAAVHFLELSLLSLLMAGSKALRGSGFRPGEEQAVLESAAATTVRNFLKAGHSALPNLDVGMVDCHLRSLFHVNRELAEYYTDILRAAKRFRGDLPVDC